MTKIFFYIFLITVTTWSIAWFRFIVDSWDTLYIKPYRQAPVQSEEIKRQVDKLLTDNVIQESYSPWSAPVHLVPKKMDASGEVKYRMVVDYRRLNEITIDDKYPFPISLTYLTN